MKNIDIKNIADFFNAIKQIKEEFNVVWYRGITKKDTYKLEPSIYRDDTISVDSEKNILGQFKSQAAQFINPLPQSEWEWFFWMQHYGVPTRLMDWSESPIVSLTFALKNIKDDIPKEDAIIYCLNPNVLNSLVNGVDFDKKNPIIFLDDNINPIYGIGIQRKQNLPIAIIGPLNNKRIIAQKGVFTLFPYELEKDIIKHDKVDTFLATITLKKENVVELKEHLENVGFTYDNLFPGIDSIAKSIKKSYKSK